MLGLELVGRDATFSTPDRTDEHGFAHERNWTNYNRSQILRLIVRDPLDYPEFVVAG